MKYLPKTGLSVLCLVIATVGIISAIGNQARSSDYLLTQVDFEWMLGPNLSAFNAAMEIVARHKKNPGLNVCTEEEINSIFQALAPERKITSINKYDVVTDFHYFGWVITLDGDIKVGIRNIIASYSGETFGPEIVIGKSSLAPGTDSPWMGKQWFLGPILPFHALFIANSLDVRDRQHLLVQGTHRSDEYIVEEFSRESFLQPVTIVPRNPPRKNLDEIYTDASLLPSGKTLEDLKKIYSNPKRAVIALLDTGVDYNHPEIAYKLFNGIDFNHRQILGSEREKKSPSSNKNLAIALALSPRGGRGWDFIENDDRPFDYERAFFRNDATSHGTAIASVAAGDGEDTAVLPIRFIGTPDVPSSLSTGQRFELAVAYAKACGARIINMSFGGYLMSDSVKAQLAKAFGAAEIYVKDMVKQNHQSNEDYYYIAKVIRENPDLLFVTSAGNEAAEGALALRDADKGFPVLHSNAYLNLPNVLVVASTKPDHTLSDFSVYGHRTIHVAALGENPNLPFAGGKSDDGVGTSLAAAYVSNSAGYIVAKKPNITILELTRTLRKLVTVTPDLQSKLVWGGYLDFENVKKSVSDQAR